MHSVLITTPTGIIKLGQPVYTVCMHKHRYPSVPLNWDITSIL